MDGCFSEPKKFITDLHAYWGHAPARLLRRVSVDSGGATMGLADYVDGALGRCEIRRPFEEAPRFPIAAASIISMFNGKFASGPAVFG